MAIRAEREREPKIVRSEDVCGNRPRVAGTRITVDDLIAFRRMVLDEIVSDRIHKAFPHLTDAQIEAAFEYYRDYPEEIDPLINQKRAALKKSGQLPAQPPAANV